MAKASRIKPFVLGILFFLPVTFLLFLYPSTHNYNPLDIVKENVVELSNFRTPEGEAVQLQDQITVLGFLGTDPVGQSLSALNLKEMIYDKFKGFKRFQIIMVLPNAAADQLTDLKKDLYQYEVPEYWHFALGEKTDIERLYSSLRFDTPLSETLASDRVFIVDKERYQRGRLDDRSKNELDANDPVYGLYAYNCIEVAELKNKMSEDIRILFTEYRQKRKGDFNSSIRRANDLNTNDKN